MDGLYGLHTLRLTTPEEKQHETRKRLHYREQTDQMMIYWGQNWRKVGGGGVRTHSGTLKKGSYRGGKLRGGGGLLFPYKQGRGESIDRRFKSMEKWCRTRCLEKVQIGKLG